MNKTFSLSYFTTISILNIHLLSIAYIATIQANLIIELQF